MLRNYLNIGIALVLAGALIACGTLIIDQLRKRRTHKLYKQLLIGVAIAGAVTGGLIDRLIGPYLLFIRERLSGINVYTPIIFSLLFIFIFKKIIDNIET